MSQAFDVRLDPVAELEELRRAWTELETKSNCSYFLSWAWIGTWLDLICNQRKARLVSVRQGTRLIALGVITAKHRFRGMGPLHLRLHEVGDQALDNLTIEYNGLLTAAGHEKAVLTAVVRYLAKNDHRWLTLHLPGVDIAGIDFENLQPAGLDLRTKVRATPYIDMARLRQDGDDYIATLPARVRGNIRRTQCKLVDAFGEASIETAATSAERLEFFHELVRLHQARWAARGSSGAFADPRLVAFHERQITDASTTQGAQLQRLRCGTQTIGYLYCFLWRDTTYYYQAGIDYARFDRYGSPGLLLLARSVQAATQAGLARYELMAGDAQYKRYLGNAEGRMAWVSVDRIGLVSRAREIWWSLRRRVRH